VPFARGLPFVDETRTRREKAIESEASLDLPLTFPTAPAEADWLGSSDDALAVSIFQIWAIIKHFLPIDFNGVGRFAPVEWLKLGRIWENCLLLATRCPANAH
jgi:hypothetical protein